MAGVATFIYGYSFGVVTTPLALVIADARLPPVARTATMGLDLATGLCQLLWACWLLKQVFRLWPTLRRSAMDIATVLWYRLQVHVWPLWPVLRSFAKAIDTVL